MGLIIQTGRIGDSKLKEINDYKRGTQLKIVVFHLIALRSCGN